MIQNARTTLNEKVQEYGNRIKPSIRGYDYGLGDLLTTDVEPTLYACGGAAIGGSLIPAFGYLMVGGLDDPFIGTIGAAGLTLGMFPLEIKAIFGGMITGSVLYNEINDRRKKR